MEETMQVAQPKKSAGLKVILAVVAALVVLVGAGATYWYTSGNIDGTWRSAELEKELMKELGKEMEDPEFEEQFGVAPVTMIKDPRVQLTIKNGKANLSIQYQIDKESFSDAYESFRTKSYQNFLEEIEKDVKGTGVTKEAALEQVYGKDYEKAIKAEIPSKEEIMAVLDESVKESAASEGGSYDSKTGIVSATADEGKVNQLTRTITNAKNEGKKLLDDIEYSKYSRSGNTLTLDGEEKYTFKLEK